MRTIRFTLHCIIILFVLPAFAAKISSQHFSNDKRKILELQDIRSLGEDRGLLEYLKSVDPKILSLTLTALANIQDTSVTDDVYKVMMNNSGNPGIRAIAAFTLGQLNSKHGVQLLFSELGKEKDKNVLIEIIKAIGFTGTENDLNKLAEYTTTDSEVNTAIAVSISRFAYRKIKNEYAVNKIKELINSTDQFDLMRFSAYALARIGDYNLLLPARNEIIKLTQQDHPETCMWAYSALGRLKDIESLKYLSDAYKRENDWKIQVNILNAIGNTDKRNITDSLMELLFNIAEYSNTSVSISALNVIGRLLERYSFADEQKIKVRDRLQWYFSTSRAVDWQVKSEAVKTYAKIFKDEAKDDLMAYYSMTPNYDIKAEIIRSFSNMSEAMIYREVRDSINTDVQKYNAQKNITEGDMISGDEMAKLYKAFIELIYNSSGKLDKENKNNARLILTEFLSSRNPAIVDICLSALKDSLFAEYKNETTQIILFDYSELQYPKDLDVMLMYIQAMNDFIITNAADLLKKNLKSENYDIAKSSADALLNITGNNYENQIKAVKYRTDFDWDFIEAIFNKSIANIYTNKGLIKIQLDVLNAPFTVQNFVKLADKHYFDNLIFHRVVPNFVIQGGDPTGIGYGGPGYSIRTEISPIGFGPYSVGMASNGKDTEGSQFFITHSSQPHLDTRYTVFGKVIDGQQVVDEIQIGDYIESVAFTGK